MTDWEEKLRRNGCGGEKEYERDQRRILARMDLEEKLVKN